MEEEGRRRGGSGGGKRREEMKIQPVTAETVLQKGAHSDDFMPATNPYQSKPYINRRFSPPKKKFFFLLFHAYFLLFFLINLSRKFNIHSSPPLPFSPLKKM